MLLNYATEWPNVYIRVYTDVPIFKLNKNRNNNLTYIYIYKSIYV